MAKIVRRSLADGIQMPKCQINLSLNIGILSLICHLAFNFYKHCESRSNHLNIPASGYLFILFLRSLFLIFTLAQYQIHETA
jgi:hypothetical protein